MGYVCKISYVAYFYDKQIFDSSPDEGEGTIDIFLGDV
jgi:hypothetical protein